MCHNSRMAETKALPSRDARLIAGIDGAPGGYVTMRLHDPARRLRLLPEEAEAVATNLFRAAARTRREMIHGYLNPEAQARLDAAKLPEGVRQGRVKARFFDDGKTEEETK